MNSNNLPTLEKESIWDKIKKFFIKDKKQIETNKYIVPEEKRGTSNNINNDNSLNDLKLINKPNKTLEDLQYLIRSNQIKDEDLSEKERIELRKLYESQIMSLRKSIKEYKHKIIGLKNKNVKKVFE